MDNTLWSDVIRLSIVAGVGWSTAWFIIAKQNVIYRKIEEIKEAIVSKLEYHERHDDTRFEALRRDIWEVRLSQARLGHNGKAKEGKDQH